MKPNAKFQNLPKSFWAAVRTISQKCGYTVRGTGMVKVPSLNEMEQAYADLGFRAAALSDPLQPGITMGARLHEYFLERASILNDHVAHSLMNLKEAKAEFERIKSTVNSVRSIPMNKQSGKKRTPAYLTAIVNLLIEANSAEHPVVYDPRQLTTITANGVPLRTLSRRIDGAFPSIVNPVAVWEIKEYYHTTTFGSRVADGIYETQLDGMELEELTQTEHIHVRHYLFLDARYTWWDCGRSYLCRIVDMLHMGYIDEFLVGREVSKRLPGLVREWVKLLSSS